MFRFSKNTWPALTASVQPRNLARSSAVLRMGKSVPSSDAFANMATPEKFTPLCSAPSEAHLKESRACATSKWALELELVQTHKTQKPLLAVGRSGWACGAQKARARWGGVGRRRCLAWRLCAHSYTSTCSSTTAFLAKSEPCTLTRPIADVTIRRHSTGQS